jgi:hypothetical protein
MIAKVLLFFITLITLYRYALIALREIMCYFHCEKKISNN